MLRVLGLKGLAEVQQEISVECPGSVPIVNRASNVICLGHKGRIYQCGNLRAASG